MQNDEFAQNGDKANEMGSEHNQMMDNDPVNPEEMVRATERNQHADAGVDDSESKCGSSHNKLSSNSQ